MIFVVAGIAIILVALESFYGDYMRIVISMGDPAGVGPEVIIKALAGKNYPDISFLIIGDKYYFEQALAGLGLELDYKVVTEPEFKSAGITLFQPELWAGAYDPVGKWSEQTGLHSLGYVRAGVELCLQHKAEALVTAPICKSAWKAAGCEFPGHTELIGEMCGVHDEVMMLVGGGLRVALVTTHAPISSLSEMITTGRVLKVLKILSGDLQRRFAVSSPHIAVLGLNPHAGEDGHIGTEELTSINPAVAAARKEGIDASWALPADTAFYRMLHGEFDAILAMYHDQGLGPLKTLAFDSGVNITLGLPVIRTSVDHGTAFDIAGTGKASGASMVSAIEAAISMAKNEQLN